MPNQIILDCTVLAIFLGFAVYCRYWIVKRHEQIAAALTHPALPLIHKKTAVYLSWLGALVALAVIAMCALLTSTFNRLHCGGLGSIVATILYAGFSGFNIMLKGYYDSVLTMQRNYR